MLLIRAIQSLAPGAPNPLHISLNYNPSAQTLCSPRQKRSPQELGISCIQQGENSLGHWLIPAGSTKHVLSEPLFLMLEPPPSPQQLQALLALPLPQREGTG